jgi:hypothetical protein
MADSNNEKPIRGRPKKGVSPNLVNVQACYCRKCMQRRSGKDFYDATDNFLDSNGKMSICKFCIDDMFKRFTVSEGSVDRAILKLCKILNVKFDNRAVQTLEDTMKKMEGNGTVLENSFGVYKRNLFGSGGDGIRPLGEKIDLTYVEVSQFISDDSLNDYEETDLDYLNRFWGSSISFTAEDYEFLETEFSDWKKTHKCDTKAEESLLKELCYKELEIRKARIQGKSTATLVTEKQALMKTASVDPAKAALANAGKSQDTYSSFIKRIEENDPAEFYKDKKLFKDFDNLDWYFKKYLVRPVKNFITQSRDFNVEQESEDDETDFLTGENEESL